MDKISFFSQNTSYFAGFGSKSCENHRKTQSKPSPQWGGGLSPLTPFLAYFLVLLGQNVWTETVIKTLKKTINAAFSMFFPTLFFEFYRVKNISKCLFWNAQACQKIPLEKSTSACKIQCRDLKSWSLFQFFFLLLWASFRVKLKEKSI